MAGYSVYGFEALAWHGIHGRIVFWALSTTLLQGVMSGRSNYAEQHDLR